MKRDSDVGLYLLLVVVALISMSYYVLGALALRQEYFYAEQQSRPPFDIQPDGKTLTNLKNEAKAAGLSAGDVLTAVNGRPYRGTFDVNGVPHMKPGGTLTVMVRSRSGHSQDAHILLHPAEGPGFTTWGYIAQLTPVLGLPLLSLIVGYWVVAARPRDLNAWLVLGLLAFIETAFGNLDWTFWPEPWFLIWGTWHIFIQIFVCVALVWFGVYFPERWRADRRLPWVKWLVFGAGVFSFFAEISAFYLLGFDVRDAPLARPFEEIADQSNGWFWAVCSILFLLAIFDKLRSASTPDARRRLRVLAIGSALSFVPLLFIFGVVLHSGSSSGIWDFIVIPFLAPFPLTLAYVLIVQRAMDVRILLRMGTKYLLARATLVIIESAIGIFVIARFLVPLLERKGHPEINAVLVTTGAALLFRVFFMGNSLGTRAQRWVDRKFFREAYNSELVLSELSERARRLTDKQTLLDTVLRQISEVLHVPQITVWLRGSDVFYLQSAIGFDLLGPVMLREDSATVQNLARTNRPATVYGDRPEEWLAQVKVEERAILQEVNAELLLPLPGRESLLGLMALGPKRSEEPYTPTDLRVLQSVAAQTGLTLEVTELAESLASEAAQRERIRREIEIAREVQQRLFPQSIPQVPGVSLAGMCRPALEVGGDYYDFLELEDGRLGLAVGDVSGKGISAALIMAGLRASLRSLTLDSPSDLARMMEKVNRLVYEASSSNRYATFFFAIYDPKIGELQYVNAGHNAPMLFKADSKEVVRLEVGGLVVGLLPVARYQAQSIAINKGDLLMAYTDGISEAMTADDEEWGEERMIAATPTSARNADDVLESIFRACDEFTAGAEQHDDMTVLVLKAEMAVDERRLTHIDRVK